MKVCAILAVRNEELYIETCIRYLVKQGIDVVIIDNESEDRTLEICQHFLGKGILHIDHFPYQGFYDWKGLLQRKQTIRNDFSPEDWVIHHDADEIMESDSRDEQLSEAITRVDQLGYDAINFDEFVFVPETNELDYSRRDYLAQMNYYYFFEPSKYRLARAFKNNLKYSNVESAGHRLPIDKIKLYPQNFTLRHYITLSIEQLRKKYSARTYSPAELAMGWHGNRVNRNFAAAKSPGVKRLQKKIPNENFSRKGPHRTHFWDW